MVANESKGAGQYMITGPDVLEWHKSSYSTKADDCVETVVQPGRTLVRDSKNPDGGVLEIGASSWRRFIADVVAGR